MLTYRSLFMICFICHLVAITGEAKQLEVMETELVALINAVLPSTVTVESQNATSAQSQNVGSGVIIREDGYILTSSQVTGSAKSAWVQFHDGNRVKADIIGNDQLTGTSLLKVDGNYKCPPLGDSKALSVGSWILTIGNSYGLSFSPSTGFVSHLRREIGERQLIQVSVPIRPGDSGAPVFNNKGQLIGIVVAALGNQTGAGTANFVDDGRNTNIGFVTPINDIKSILTGFIAKGKVDRGWLGVQMRKLSAAEAKQTNMAATNATVIYRVIKESPAEKAGFLTGDIIIRIDGRPIEGGNDIRTYILNQPPKKMVQIELMRKGQPLSLQVELGEMPRLNQ